MIKYIQSTKNDIIVEIKKVRQLEGFFWWEGIKFYEEVLAEKIIPQWLIVTEDVLMELKSKRFSIIAEKEVIVSEKVFQRLSFTKSPQGIGGIIKIKKHSFHELINKKSPIFYLGGLQDPGNVGAIIRIADAFGFGGIIYERRGASPYNEKAVRGSAGSILRMPCVGVDSYEVLFNCERPIFFLTPHLDNAESIENVDKNRLKCGVFVLGMEGKGIDFKIDKAEYVYIPMREKVESLNVAVSAGIVAYEAARAKK